MTVKPKSRKPPSSRLPMVPTTDTMKLPNDGIVSIHVKRKSSRIGKNTADGKRKCRKCVGRPRGPYRTNGLSPAERLLNAIIEAKPCKPMSSPDLRGKAKKPSKPIKANAKKSARAKVNSSVK